MFFSNVLVFRSVFQGVLVAEKKNSLSVPLEVEEFLSKLTSFGGQKQELGDSTHAQRDAKLALCRGQLRALGLYGTAFPRRGERSRSQLLFGEDHFVQQLYNCGFQVLGCIHLFERARGTNH